MSTSMIVWKNEGHWKNYLEWDSSHWLGQEVEFKLCGHTFRGEVVEAERIGLCNGIHDILTVEIWDNDSQVKVQAHRQKFRRVE